MEVGKTSRAWNIILSPTRVTRDTHECSQDYVFTAFYMPLLSVCRRSVSLYVPKGLDPESIGALILFSVFFFFFFFQ